MRFVEDPHYLPKIQARSRPAERWYGATRFRKSHAYTNDHGLIVAPVDLRSVALNFEPMLLPREGANPEVPVLNIPTISSISRGVLLRVNIAARYRSGFSPAPI